MGNTPCFGCDKRTMTCHNTCEKYKEYSDAIRQKRKVEWEQREENRKYENYKRKQIVKGLKGRRKGKKYEM